MLFLKLLPVLQVIYRFGFVSGHHQLIQLPARAVIALFFVISCWKLFIPTTRNHYREALVAVAGIVGLATWSMPCTLALLVASLLALLMYCTVLMHGNPDDGVGHRCGAEGFKGGLCENTLEALRELVAKDKRGEIPSDVFPYIEFDVYEVKDGELVVFHDMFLTNAFPIDGANAAAAKELLAEGIEIKRCKVTDLTSKQLERLCIAGRKGLKVPTLKAFLEECIRLKVEQTLAVEVKMLKTDAGRAKFIDLLSWYAASDHTVQTTRRWYPPLGKVGVIAFPHFFAQSFGEFGGKTWRVWAQELNAGNIPALACHLHQLNLAYNA